MCDKNIWESYRDEPTEHFSPRKTQGIVDTKY